MSNVLEALLQVGRQLSWQKADRRSEVIPDADKSETTEVLSGEMADLYLSIKSLLPDMPKKAIQFIGSRAGEGVSTVVREFAGMATARLGKSVMIIDADHRDGQRKHFDITNRYGWEDAIRDPELATRAATRIGEGNLYVSCCCIGTAQNMKLFTRTQIRAFLDSMKEHYDLLLIDSPPAATGAEMLEFCKAVDGVVLVVEAERTRWHVVESVKNKILRNDGKIVGVVLNKRRNYIPDFIYKRL